MTEPDQWWPSLHTIEYYLWDPETDTREWGIDEFPFVCRRHGFAGHAECPECVHEFWSVDTSDSTPS